MALRAIEHGGHVFEPEEVARYHSGVQSYRFVAPGTGLNVDVEASTQADSASGVNTEEDHLTLDAIAASPAEEGEGVVLTRVVVMYEDMNYPPAPDQQELYEARITHAATAVLAVFMDDPKG